MAVRTKRQKAAFALNKADFRVRSVRAKLARERQPAQPASGRREDGIAERWRDDRRTRLADAAGCFAVADVMHVDFRRLVDAQDTIDIEIGLISLNIAALRPKITPPCIWASTVSGLTVRPQSTATVTRLSVISPADETSTSITQAR